MLKSNQTPSLLVFFLLGVILTAPGGSLVAQYTNPAYLFVRGDANADEHVDISDATHVLSHLFTAGLEPSCLKAADANDDGLLDVSDPVFLLTYLFGGGPALPSPADACGVDLTDDPLTCTSYPSCTDCPLGDEWYSVRDNGDCSADHDDPCFGLTGYWWTPDSDRFSGVRREEILLTDLNLRHLRGEGCSVLDGSRLRESILAGGYQVSGIIQEGPVGPAGLGRTLVGFHLRIANERKADLTVPSFETTGGMTFPLGGGFVLPVRAVVTNEDSGRAWSPFLVAVKASGITVKTWTVESLDSGASTTLSATLRFSNSYLGTTISLRVVADSSDEYWESDESNNESRSITVEFPSRCEVIDVMGRRVRICF